MIHCVYNTNPTTFLVRPLQRTAKSPLDRSKLIYLVQFKSDLQQREIYAYTSNITDVGSKTNKSDNLYSEIDFKQVTTKAAQDVYLGKIHLLPAGYWYYVIYEVYFPAGIIVDYEGTPFNLLAPGYAPINGNNDIEAWGEVGPTPSVSNQGQLGVIVEEGKLQVKRTPTQVTYKQHTQTQDNYIYND